jgi:hypothetical protein
LFSVNQFDLKALSKSSRKKLEIYQQLAFKEFSKQELQVITTVSAFGSGKHNSPVPVMQPA